MVAYRNFKKQAYKKKTGSKKRSYPKKKTGVSFEKRVKTVISKMAENKSSDFRGALNLYSSNNSNYISSITPMTPFTSFLTIPQGVGQGERTGNSITVKKLTLKGVIQPLPYDVTTNPIPKPCYVKLFFLTRKDTPQSISTNTTDVFQYSNTSEGFGTSLQNLMRNINTDEWMVHTIRTFKVGYADYTGTGSTIAAQYNANNDFKLANFVNIDLTKYCHKVIKFDDNSVTPSTRNIILYPVVYSTSSTTPAVNEALCNMAYTLHLEYEDM